MRTLKRLGWLLLVVLILAFCFVQLVTVPSTDHKMNAVTPHAPYPVSEAAKRLHESLYVADLHADSLLWRRNPEHRHNRGHVDFPRLREGGVNFQIMSAVTKSPRGLNFDGNDSDAPDNVTLLAMAQLWPVKTWSSIYERAAHQARRLHKLASNPDNNLIIARTANDMTQSAETLITVLLTEGSHPLEGKIENIDRLYDHGYRAMGLQHFFDNELGGSMHGRTQAGLSDFGEKAVAHMVKRGIIIDVAHSSVATVRDVLDRTDVPLLLSHGGVLSHCPKTANRNLPDEILKEMAARNSLIGIGYFDGVICDISPKGIASAIIYGVELLGEDIIALGSDYDGTVAVSLDTSELAAITHELIEQGLPEPVIRKVMGENARRFFTQNLPQK